MQSKLLILLTLYFTTIICQAGNTTNSTVISRNTRVQEMIDGLETQNQFYEEIIEDTKKTMSGENEECKKRINELNCSNVEVWENLRRKHSKNITNLQDKMKKHNETIYQILQYNKALVERKNGTLMGLFPQIKKLKNDQEMIDIMLMVIDDTYVRTEEIDLEAEDENSTAAVFILSEIEKELKEVNRFIQMRKNVNESTTNTPNLTLFELPLEVEFVEEGQSGNETNETDPDEELPLIDEEYFEDENETNYTYQDPDDPEFPLDPEDENETNETDPDPEPEPLMAEHVDEDEIGDENETNETDPDLEFPLDESEQLIADDIPEGKDVQEHDEGHLEKISQRNQTREANQTVVQHYDLKQLKKSLVERVKLQGTEMFKELSVLRKELKLEQENKLEQISAYERAIYLIHQKHMHEIVEIYKENRKLYVQILEKDDAVMQLDAKINECRNIDEYEQSCDDIKNSLAQFIDDSKSQINFNNAAIKELEKLLEYEDKNVYDPAYQQSSVQSTPNNKGPMNYYEDYQSVDNGELVKRTIQCKVTECREKRYQSQEKFELLLTNKYNSLNEDSLLKETQFQVDKGTQLDERFDIKEQNDNNQQQYQQQQKQEQQEQQEQLQKVMSKKMHTVEIGNLSPPEELQPMTDDSLINEMKEKLELDVGGTKNEEKKPKVKQEKAQLETQTKHKKNIVKKAKISTKKSLKKAKISKDAKKSLKKAKISKDTKKNLKKAENQVKNSTQKQKLTEKQQVVKQEQNKENIFKKALHYFFGPKNNQGFSEINQGFTQITKDVNRDVNDPIDFLAQFN